MEWTKCFLLKVRSRWKPRELGHQLSGEGMYTHGIAFEIAACNSSCYVQRARADPARVVVLCRVALGWWTRVFIRWGLGGRAQTDEKVDTWIQQHNRKTNRLLCCCTTNSCCCAVPALMLKPGNTFGPGSTRAGRGAGPPYSSRYSHHRGNCCVIHSSSIEAIWIHVQRRLCPCASEIPSTPRRMYPFRLFAQETEHNISAWYYFTQSRYFTRAYHVSRKYRDMWRRYKTRQAYNLAVNDQYRDFSDFYISLIRTNILDEVT